MPARLPQLMLLALPMLARAEPLRDPGPLLHELGSEYRWAGLPVPPREAQLASRDYTLGLLYRQPGIGVVFLAGLKSKHGRDLAGAPTPIKEIQAGPLPGNQENLLLLAVQCHLIGQEKAALAILKALDSRRVLSVEARTIRQIAWSHWESRLRDDGTDWSQFVGHLRAIHARERYPGMEASILASAEAALSEKPTPRKVGPLLEAIIRKPSSYGFHWGRPSPEYERLRWMGFRAVPDLIRALDDTRPTRRVFTSMKGDHPMRVDQVASDLLMELADADTVSGWSEKREDRAFPHAWPRKEVEKWWVRVRRMGPGAYLMETILAEKAVDGRVPWRLLVADYPEEIPRLYRAILRGHPAKDGAWALRAIIEGPLPGRTKRALLMEGASRGSRPQRWAALALLRAIYPDAFFRLCAVELNGMPPAWQESDEFKGFAPLADMLRDRRSWPWFKEVLRTAHPRTQARLLARIGPRAGGAWARNALLFISEHLPDTTPIPKADVDNPARGRFPLTCGHVLATLIAPQLGIDPPRGDTGRVKDWDTFRDKVAAAAKLEK